MSERPTVMTDEEVERAIRAAVTTFDQDGVRLMKTVGRRAVQMHPQLSSLSMAYTVGVVSGMEATFRVVEAVDTGARLQKLQGAASMALRYIEGEDLYVDGSDIAELLREALGGQDDA